MGRDYVKRLRGERLACGHESLLPVSLIYTDDAYCEKCQGRVARVPKGAKQGKSSRPSGDPKKA